MRLHQYRIIDGAGLQGERIPFHCIFYLKSCVQESIEWLEKVVIVGLSLLGGGGDGTRTATKNKVEFHILYLNCSIM